MAITPIKHVAPGDLITASFCNGVIDAILSLQEQIDGLVPGGGLPGAPIITRVEPQPVKAGSKVTILGRNFAIPAVFNTVMLTSVPSDSGPKVVRELNDFASGTDTSLVVTVPGDLPGLPRTLLLTVETTDGKDERSIAIEPPVVQVKGQVKVINVTAPLGAITEDGTYTFQMRLDASALNVPEDFTIRADYDNANAATTASWTKATLYLGTSSEHVVRVDPKTPVTVGVQFKVPIGAKSVDMTVRAISANNHPASSNSSPVIPIAVGLPPLPTDTSIGLTIKAHNQSIIRNKAFSGAFTGPGLEVKYGTTPAVSLRAEVEHAGTYKVDATIEGEDGGTWKTIGLPQNIALGAKDTDDVQFQLQLLPASPPASDVTRYLRFSATRQETDGVGQISNYLRFAIGGFVV